MTKEEMVQFALKSDDTVENTMWKIYQQGRADKDKELSELPNQYSEKLWKNAYRKGRTDVLEEIKQSIIPTLYEFDVMQDTIDFCVNILEQLKEQGNG